VGGGKEAPVISQTGENWRYLPLGRKSIHSCVIRDQRRKGRHVAREDVAGAGDFLKRPAANRHGNTVAFEDFAATSGD